MHKLSKCFKAQFFIISAALVITSISIMAFYLQSLFLPTATSISVKGELEYIDVARDVLCKFYYTEKRFDTRTYLAHLEEVEETLEDYFAEHGILLSITHEILDNKIIFRYNLSGFGFKSESFVKAPCISWWNLHWLYRRPVLINNTLNSNNLYNYQVLVVLDTQTLISSGKMRADCGDIRFIGSDDETELNYWIEGGCNTPNTRIWVKVPFIPANGVRKIYLYYGNSSATSESNGTKVFEFFDDFSESIFTSYLNRLTDCNSGDFDPLDWCTVSDTMDTITNTSSTYYTPPHGSYLNTGNTGFCGDAGLVTELTIPNVNTDLLIEFYARTSGGTRAQYRGVAIEKNGYGYAQKDCDELSGGNYNNVYWLACAYRRAIPVPPQPCSNLVDPETGNLYTPPLIDTDWTFISENITRYRGETVRLRILVMDYSCDWCDSVLSRAELWVDDIRIRQYSSPEPFAEVGEEEVVVT